MKNHLRFNKDIASASRKRLETVLNFLNVDISEHDLINLPPIRVIKRNLKGSYTLVPETARPSWYAEEYHHQVRRPAIPSQGFDYNSRELDFLTPEPIEPLGVSEGRMVQYAGHRPKDAFYHVTMKDGKNETRYSFRVIPMSRIEVLPNGDFRELPINRAI